MRGTSGAIGLVLTAATLAATSRAGAQDARTTCLAANTLRHQSPDVAATLDSMIVEWPLTVAVQGGFVIASGGIGGTVAARAEYVTVPGILVGAIARANFTPARTYFGEVRLGLLLEHEYGTSWVPAGIGTYDTQSSESHEEGEYVVTTTTTTTHLYAWPDHCRMDREDSGPFVGARATLYGGDDSDIPARGGALSAGYFLRERGYSGGSGFSDDGTLGILVAPPGFSGDKWKYGVFLEVASAIDSFLIGLDVGGIFGQYGYLTLDAGLLFDL